MSALAQRDLLFKNHLAFTKTFFPIRNNREFATPLPPGRRSHFIEISSALDEVYAGHCDRLLIQIPPRYAKTTAIIYFMAKALAQYPDCNFIYASYAQSLAALQTYETREIINLPVFRDMFGTCIAPDRTAKDDWQTTMGGSVFAAGTGGPITGRGAGIRGCKRFGGALIFDDVLKPKDAPSDTVRTACNEWFYNTFLSRINDKRTPIIGIAQALHEDDLMENLKKLGTWETVILKALDDAGNALYPEMHTADMLIKMREEQPYIFYSQYQQQPIPAGGALYKRDDFLLLEKEPDIICSFITVDTAQTTKTYNDPTVFSFWGIYEIKINNVETGQYALHCLDCLEKWIEPRDLQNELLSFHAKCMRHYRKPLAIAIENKNTGVTLNSALKIIPGLRIIEIERTVASGPKGARYIEMQPFVAQHRLTLTESAKHANMFIEHMIKITANDSHSHDDICDTAYDAIKLALIDETLLPKTMDQEVEQNLQHLNQAFNRSKSISNQSRRI
jgi:predicted phage terminase large subunit-like protein